MKRLITIGVWCVLASAALGETRKGKAVYETSPENGMKLTDKALQNIEVKTEKLSGSARHSIPRASLVFFQDDVGVYRFRDGWFKLVKVTVLNKDKAKAEVQGGELKASDSIVVYGADLLRVSELDAMGGGE